MYTYYVALYSYIYNYLTYTHVYTLHKRYIHIVYTYVIYTPMLYIQLCYIYTYIIHICIQVQYALPSQGALLTACPLISGSASIHRNKRMSLQISTGGKWVGVCVYILYVYVYVHEYYIYKTCMSANHSQMQQFICYMLFIYI